MDSTSGEQSVRIVMRASCPRCGCDDGLLATVGGQDTVRCAECNRFHYNAPRSETGRETRSLRTRPDIRPSQRARILMRDNGTCILCHRCGVDLEAGHMISVYDGRKLGMSDAELNSDDNLAAMCKPCNSGLGNESLPPRWMAAAIWARRLNDGNDGDRRPA
jgi:5-methylcytosine-specific restriction endonuclease McrA